MFIFAACGVFALRLYAVSPTLSSLTSFLPGAAFLVASAAMAVQGARAVVVLMELRRIRAASLANEVAANPSIERTAVGKPPAAAHVER
jgi:hypothetical protein